jgi:hypothetical protein
LSTQHSAVRHFASNELKMIRRQTYEMQCDNQKADWLSAEC